MAAEQIYLRYWPLAGVNRPPFAGRSGRAHAACIPVVLDGFICSAAVAPLFGTAAGSLDHCLVGHVSAEPGHKHLLAAMGKSAILHLDMRLGEGSGAAVALSVLRGAVACHNQMATFESAGIAGA